MPKYCITYSTRKKSGNKNEEEQYHAVRIMKVLAPKRNTKYLGDGDSSAFKTVSER